MDNLSNYTITTDGNVLKKEKLMKISIKGGYSFVRLTTDQKKNKGFYVHYLVAQVYLPNPNNYTKIVHKDNNYLNNKVENLMWVETKKLNTHKKIVDLEGETWKEIPKYPGYEASNKGRIRNKNGFVLKQHESGGYLRLALQRERYKELVHRLVAMAFLENPQNYETVDHIDRDKLNNNPENLRWASRETQDDNKDLSNRKYVMRPVVQLDTKGNVVKKFPSAKQAEEETGVARSSIKDCCKGRLKQSGGFNWEYAQNDNLLNGEIFKKYNNFEVSNKGRIRAEYGRLTYGYKSNNYIHFRGYRVHRLVAELFVDKPETKDLVNHIDGNKHNNNAQNLEWVDCSENSKHSCEVLQKNCKKVYQYNFHNELVNTFYSIAFASKETGINISTISACLHGRNKSGGGFIWKKT